MSENENAGHAPADLPPLEFLPTLEEWLAARDKYPCREPRSWFVMTGDVVILTGDRIIEGRSEVFVRELWIARWAEVRPRVSEKDFGWHVEIRPMKASEGEGPGVGALILRPVDIHVCFDAVPDSRSYIKAGAFKLEGGSINPVDLSEWRRIMIAAMGREKEERSLEEQRQKKGKKKAG